DLHRPTREDPAASRRRDGRRAGSRPCDGLSGAGDEVRRGARRGRRVDGRTAEPGDQVRGRPPDGGAARPPVVASGRRVRNRGGGKVKRIRFVHLAFAALVVALAVPAAGVSKSVAVPTSVGEGEGKLTLVAWEGYTEKQWVAPFEKQTGCKVTAKYAGSSNDMFNLMTSGGGSQYDMVSASGDASLRLIHAGAVAEVN